MQAPTIAEIVEAFAEEAAALDALLSDLEPDDWLRATPAEGWDVRDTVTHLADTDDLAFDCVTGGPRDLMEEAMAAGSGDAFTLGQVLKGRDKPPDQVHTWWRTSNERLREAILAADPNERVPWGPNRLSLGAFTTARLMETWAHGLDCYGAVGREPEDTDRLRHIAFLGWRALPHAFALAGVEGPGPVRLELTGPGGDRWDFGGEDAPTVIRGTAADWCRVATQRARSGEAERLACEGPDAEAILSHAQAYL